MTAEQHSDKARSCYAQRQRENQVALIAGQLTAERIKLMKQL